MIYSTTYTMIIRRAKRGRLLVYSISDMFIGEYECHKYDGTVIKNTYHWVKIDLDPSNIDALIWSNRANVSWHLYKTNNFLTFHVGQDCDYYQSISWHGMTFILDKSKTKIVGLTGPSNEFYRKHN
eukprot:457558_1